MLRKIQIKYPHAQKNKLYTLASLFSTTKILLCSAMSIEQKYPFMVFLIYCNRWFIKIVKPIYLGPFYSIMNFGTIAMVTENTFICKTIKGTKTTIKYILGNCHFKWLINYKNHTNVT